MPRDDLYSKPWTKEPTDVDAEPIGDLLDLIRSERYYCDDIDGGAIYATLAMAQRDLATARAMIERWRAVVEACQIEREAERAVRAFKGDPTKRPREYIQLTRDWQDKTDKRRLAVDALGAEVLKPSESS